MASTTTKTRRQRQIAAESRLKFRPAESKLAQQLRDAAGELERGEATARSVAETVRNAAKSAIPQITKATQDQQGLAERLRGVAPALPADSSYAKVASVEQTGADTRLGEMRTQAITDFVKQQAQATAGEAYQVQNVRNRYSAAKDRITQAQMDVAAQKGDYEAQRSGEFAESDLSAARSRASQKRSFAQQDKSREDSQRASREAAARKEAETRRRDAAKEKNKDPKKGPEGKIQKEFSQAVSKLAVSTYEVPDPKDPKKVIDKPITPDYVKKNRATVEAGIRAGTGMSPEMARRVVQAFLRVGKGDPGSFKSYRKRNVGPAIKKNATLPKNPFG